MTLMKIRLGRRKDEGSLQPLTEKEIQKKLYGAYWEESENSFKDKDEVESILGKPPRAKQKKIFAWQEAVSSFLKAFAGLAARLAKFSRKLLRKTASGWGASVLVIALLFFGIHVLNGYRERAMKASKPKIPLETPVKKAAPDLASVSPAPPPPAVVEPPPPLPRKPFVIQVCTYARQRDAERLADKMKAAQIPAFVEPMDRANGKTFYPVFLGRFETFQEAQAKLKEFKGKPASRDFQDSFIRTL